MLKPLTVMQSGIYFDQSRSPDSPRYIIGSVLEMHAEIDVESMHNAVLLIAQKVDVLSLKLEIDQDGNCLQRFGSEREPEFMFYDFSGHENPNLSANAAINKQYRKPFDIFNDRLLSSTLYRLGATEYWLVLKSHHLITDGFGLFNLIRLIEPAYIQISTGHEAQEINGIHSFKDLVDQENDYLRSLKYSQSKDFWCRKLANMPDLILKKQKAEIGASFPRSWHMSVEIDAVLEAKLRTACQERKLSLQQLGLAAVSLYIAKAYDREDFIIGVPVHRRKNFQQKRMVGTLAGDIPCRINLKKASTCSDLLNHISRELQDSYRHASFPQSHLMRVLNLSDLGRDDLFDVVYNYELYDRTVFFGGEAVRIRHLFNGAESADLHVRVVDHAGGQPTSIHVSVSQELMVEDEARLVPSRIKYILEQLSENNTEVLLSEVEITPHLERQKLLSAFTGRISEYSTERVINRCFERQVELNGDAIAVSHNRRSLSYIELNQKANEVAQRLAEREPVVGKIIAIHARRGIGFLAAMLGIWKAGGIYMPIDDKNPPERIRSMVLDADPCLIICETAFAENFPREYRERLVLLDEHDHPTASEPLLRNPENVNSEIQPAYVIYTSGSTGIPKGVLIHHWGAIHHVNAAFDYLGCISKGKPDPITMLQSAAISSDISVWQFLAPVVSGGKVVILDSATDVPLLLDTVQREEVELVECVPVVIRIILDHIKTLCSGEHPLPKLRWMLATGDAVSAPLVNDWLSTVKDVPLVNAYGPSETSDDVSFHIINEPIANTELGVPIGRPLPNTSIHILCGEDRLAPIGVVGEICISGECVGLGYLKSPKKTAEKFVANPMAGVEGVHGKTMYRTGDLGKWTVDGKLTFIGRVDNQVKIRGHRIEIGEIETALYGHLCVNDAAVVTAKDSQGDRHLVSFFTKKADLTVSADDLREFAKAKLPDFMLPTRFSLLEELPRNSSDKIDRKALQRVAEIELSSSEYAQPVTTTAAAGTLQDLTYNWSQLINIPSEKISYDSNFFSLGGHSLTAVRLVSAIRSRWGIEIGLKDIFGNPVLFKLADFIDKAKKSEAEKIKSAPISSGFPLSYAQQRLWFINQLNPDGSDYNASVGIKIYGDLTTEALKKSVFELVNRHPILKTCYADTIHDQVQEIIDPKVDLCTISDLRSIADPVKELKLHEIRLSNYERPFNLSKDPMLRCDLVRLLDDEWALFVTVHHIASDGWSQGILMRDLSLLYMCETGANQELSASVLPLPVQYKDYAYWQRNYLTLDRLREHTDYWLNQLCDLPAVHNLPLDFARPVKPSHRGGVVRTVIGGEIAEKLHTLMEKHEVTLFMVLMATFSSLLHRYSGDRDVVIGSPIANREQQELEGLVGFFVNTLVYRNTFEAELSFTDLLDQCKQRSLDAYSHQQMPFEMLVDALQPPRCTSYNPLFQVMLTLDNTSVSEWSLPGLRTEVMEENHTASQFDLSLDVVENNQDIALTWNYALDLFEHETVVRMASHFESLLSAFCNDSSAVIGSIRFISEAEQHQQLCEFNQTQNLALVSKAWPALFEEKAKAIPDSIAARSGDQKITYGELENSTFRLACSLRSRGIKPGSIVALMGERSVDYLVAIIAVLRSGAAYLPLDPTHPKERQLNILEQTRADLVLADLAGISTCWEITHGKALLIGDLLEEEIDESMMLPEVALDQLAYVIFTSGSTGNPKGVMIEHMGMVNNMLSKLEPLQLTSNDVIGQTASQCFDISVWQFLTALVIGATTDIVPAGICRDPDGLQTYIKNHGITVWEPVPSMIKEVLAQPQAQPSLRVVLPTGEKLTADLASRWFHQYSNIPLVNAYGPAECSDDVTLERIEKACAKVCIGQPIANARIHIVDAHHQLVPLGVIGEIAVSGLVVGRGYIRDKTLTAKAFIDNPYQQDALDARMYLTGDLGRRSKNGKIEFVGRKDHQVKVRGLRIELGEVEAALRKCPAVRDTSVIVHDLPDDQLQLIAFVVSDALDSHAPVLRQALAQRLPSYMVPDRILIVPGLPLNANGKVDRMALLRLIPLVQTFEAAPMTPTEEAVASIWSKLLSISISNISVNSDFFACGGHSLLSVRLVSAIQDTFDVLLPVRSIFEARDLRSLSDLIDLHISQNQVGRVVSQASLDMIEEVEF